MRTSYVDDPLELEAVALAAELLQPRVDLGDQHILLQHHVRVGGGHVDADHGVPDREKQRWKGVYQMLIDGCKKLSNLTGGSPVKDPQKILSIACSSIRMAAAAV